MFVQKIFYHMWRTLQLTLSILIYVLNPVNTDKNGKGKYFDSYGLLPDTLGFADFMNANATTWVYNNKKKILQSLFAKVCGHYCVYFILFHCRDLSMHSRLLLLTFQLTLLKKIVELLV